MPTSQAIAPKRATEQVKEAAAPRRRSIAHIGVDILASGAFLLVGLELFFSFAGVGQEEYLQYDQRFGVAPMPGKVITMRSEGYSKTKFNSLGMREREIAVAKPAGTVRVAIMGDSLTESIQVDGSKMFSTVLEQKLNSENLKAKYEVLNFGVSSYYLPQKYLRLNLLAFDFQPDLAILEMRTGEMLELMPKPLGNLVTARPFFLVDGNEKLVESRAYQYQWNQGKEAKRMRATAWLRKNSATWGVVGRSVQGVMAWRSQLGAKAPEPVDKNKTKVVNFTFAPIDPYLKRLTKALIAQAKADCAKHNCKLAIMYVTGLGTLKHDDEEKSLQAITAELGVPFLDLRKPIEAGYRVKTDEPLNWAHLAPRGHRLVADELNKFVHANFPSLSEGVAQQVSGVKEQKQNAL